MAGIAIYVALYHVLLYFRLRKRNYLSFSLLCVTIGIYAIACTGLYNVTSLAEGITWQRAQFVIEQFFAITFFWFVLDFISYGKKHFFYPSFAFFFIAAIYAPFDKAGLILNISEPAIKIIQLPFNIDITYYEAASGPLKTIIGILYLITFGFLLGVAIRYYRNGHQKEGRPLLISLFVIYGSVFNDVFIVSGIYQGFYLVEYSFIGIAIFMTLSLSNNIVDSVLVQRALKENQEQYSTLVEKMTEGLIIVDSQATITYVNDKFSEMLGYPRSEIIGKKFVAFLDPTNQKIFLINFALRRQGNSDQYEIEWTGNHDKKLHTLVSPTPLFDENRGFKGSFGIVIDITLKKTAEATLKRLYEEAMEISEMKTNLITYATHELKTPLVPIMGWSEFIKKALADGKKLDRLISKTEIESIFNSAVRLNKIIDNFLDVGRLESKRLELQKRQTKVLPLIENAMKNVAYQAKTANINIHNEIQDTEIYCDPFRIEQVFINILSNAIKYSPPETEVSCSSEIIGDEVAFYFRDQGHGFTLDELEHIWQPFSKSFPERYGPSPTSTGIGLYLSRGIVEMHGGAIEISSAGPDLGSTVKIILPMVNPEKNLP
ncbi:MAG TPA: PAS domain S-box protein [Candidatus Lokiarchaeia archaeon]|nr:PAS domain S-box protein [Candidatus Lokiarchaeia archaeon]